MRKDALQQLIKKQNNPVARLITLFLQKEDIENLPSDQDIPFITVVHYLQQNGIDLAGVASKLKSTNVANKLTIDKSDDGFFRFFIMNGTVAGYEKKEKDNATNLLDSLPEELLEMVASFCGPKSLANLSACSSTLYKSLFAWEPKLIALGCNSDIISQIKSANVIRDYEKLYRSVLRCTYTYRSMLTTRELLCLSGEVAAIKSAIDSFGLTKKPTDLCGRNALHLAAFSGSR